MASNNDEIFKKLVEATEKQFSKKFKDSETKFIRASDEKPPTGLIIDNPLLEYILDRRFLAFGRFYLIYGAKGSCKTSLFYDLSKTFQRLGGKVIWIETENAIDLDYAKNQGVNLEDVLLVHPQSLEQALNLSEMYVRNLSKLDPDGQMPILICLDSIAGSVTEYEQDSDNNITNTTPGAHARLLSRFYREMEHPLANERCVFLALNQQKHKIGGFGFGDQVAMIGGEAPMFSSTYQWKMARTGDLKQKNEHGAERKYGSEHEITCTRNKLGREGGTQKIRFDLYIKGGIDWFSPLVRMVGEGYDTIIDKNGAKYRWLLPDMVYTDRDGNEQPIPTDKDSYMRDVELGYIIANSPQAKDAIRDAFEIPPLPSSEEVEQVEQERLTKRKKKKEEEKSL